MKRVAVITAVNPGFRNPGMLSVDLAARGLLGRLGRETEVRWYALAHPDARSLPSRLGPTECPFPYLSLLDRRQEIWDHDVILIWGDFLQSRQYFTACTPLLRRMGVAQSDQEAVDHLSRALLMSDAPDEVLSRVFVFGSSLLYDRAVDLADEVYVAAFRRLIRQCRGIWMRDPISAVRVAHERGSGKASHLGIDAAFLLQTEDLRSLTTTRWSHGLEQGKHLGVFAGVRSRADQRLQAFCECVAAQLGLDIDWLPWMEIEDYMTMSRRQWLQHPLRAFTFGRHLRWRARNQRPGATVGDIFATLPNYKLIVTDTYHLCINAWRVATPVVLLGTPQPAAPRYRLVNDLKKQILSLVLHSDDLYVVPEQLRNRRQLERNAARVVQILEAQYVQRVVREIVGRQVANSTEQLTSALRNAL